MTALDSSSTGDSSGRAATVRPELTVEQSADLQSSRIPRVDAKQENRSQPFYREVHLTRDELAAIESSVNQRTADRKARPDEKALLVEAEKDGAFAMKARNGDFFCVDRYGTAESTMYNATPPQWHGGGAQSRLFEVTAAPDTTYYIGRAAPQGGAQGWAADLPGGGHQVFIPRDTDRTDWTVRAVGRSEQELATLPAGSVAGYDEVGDILVTSESAHAGDETVAVHRVGNGDPFEGVDATARAYAAWQYKTWDGPTTEKFRGSIEERVTPSAPAADVTRAPEPAAGLSEQPASHPDPADPLLGQGPLVSDERGGPLTQVDTLHGRSLAVLAEPEGAQTAIEGGNVVLEAFGADGAQLPPEAAVPLSYLAGRLQDRLERENSSPIWDDRDGPLIR